MQPTLLIPMLELFIGARSLNSASLKPFLKLTNCIQMSARFSSNVKEFNKLLNESKNVVVLTGAGVSAESGIPTFRGAGGLWRTHRAADLATPTAFQSNPALVWEFYHYRRETAFKSEPNKAHKALAAYEGIAKEQGRNVAVITQNVDGLHQRAGSTEVVELHGSLSKVVCTKCKLVAVNTESPICEALRGRENYDMKETGLPMISVKELPKCGQCQALVRPYIVWFGENLEAWVLDKARNLVENCDMCLVVGTSSVVYPAAMFAPLVAERGQPVAEFNLNDGPAFDSFRFHFAGPCGDTIPLALGVKV